MARYMPITGIDCLIPSLLIDTEAPLDVLHDTAAYRTRSVTQLVEPLSLSDSLKGDNALLRDFARVIAIPLRDGCDLLDVGPVRHAVHRRASLSPSSNCSRNGTAGGKTVMSSIACSGKFASSALSNDWDRADQS